MFTKPRRKLTEADAEDLETIWERDGPFSEQRLFERAKREGLEVTRDRVTDDFKRVTWNGKLFTRGRHTELKADLAT